MGEYKMKKLCIVILALLLLTACGANREPETIPTTVATTAATTVAMQPEDTEPEETEPPVLLGTDLKNGTYEITVDSSASMFRVVHCELTVQDGTMTAAMTMSGKGYGMVYPGTGEEAMADSEENYIPFTLDDDGHKVFVVSVAALNQEQPCAAWSIRKEKWYDRTLIFESEALPEDAFVQG